MQRAGRSSRVWPAPEPGQTEGSVPGHHRTSRALITHLASHRHGCCPHRKPDLATHIETHRSAEGGTSRRRRTCIEDYGSTPYTLVIGSPEWLCYNTYIHVKGDEPYLGLGVVAVPALDLGPPRRATRVVVPYRARKSTCIYSRACFDSSRALSAVPAHCCCMSREWSFATL